MPETTTLLPLDGCRWCGITRHGHFQRWSRTFGWHTWTPLTQTQILSRMLARPAARLNAAPAVYHAVTAWAPEYDGESATPYCADCKTDVCHRWSRIQVRLDQQRWGISRRTRRHRKTAAVGGSWGGEDLPF